MSDQSKEYKNLVSRLEFDLSVTGLMNIHKMEHTSNTVSAEHAEMLRSEMRQSIGDRAFENAVSVSQTLIQKGAEYKLRHFTMQERAFIVSSNPDMMDAVHKHSMLTSETPKPEVTPDQQNTETQDASFESSIKVEDTQYDAFENRVKQKVPEKAQSYALRDDVPETQLTDEGRFLRLKDEYSDLRTQIDNAYKRYAKTGGPSAKYSSNPFIAATELVRTAVALVAVNLVRPGTGFTHFRAPLVKQLAEAEERASMLETRMDQIMADLEDTWSFSGDDVVLADDNKAVVKALRALSNGTQPDYSKITPTTKNELVNLTSKDLAKAEELGFKSFAENLP